MNKYFERLGGLTNQHVLIVCLLITAIYYFLIFNDGTDIENVMAKAKGELIEQEKLVPQSEIALKDVGQIRSDYAALTEQYKMLQSQVPTSIDRTEILALVDQIARDSGLTIKSKEWRDPRRSGSIMEVHPLRVEAQGNFAEIHSYLSKLSENDKNIVLGTMSIEAPRNIKTNSRSKIDLELRVYRLVGDRPAEKPEKVKK